MSLLNIKVIHIYKFDRFQNADFSENFHSIFFQLKKVQNFGKSHSIFFSRRFNRKWHEDKKNKKVT